MSDRIIDRLVQLMAVATTKPSGQSTETFCGWLQEASIDDVCDTLVALLTAPTEQWEEEYSTVTSVLVEIIRRLHVQPFSLPTDANAQIRVRYAQFSDRPAVQSLLLRLLIGTRQKESLTVFADLLVENAALEPRLQVEVFGDLLKYAGDGVSGIFPRILDGLEQSGLASFVLDYANFAHRKKLVASHPATARAQQLVSLLSTLADRLGKLQESRPSSQEQAAEIGRQVHESVALGVALCDALACIGASEAVASLNKVLQVEHRRLRVEAAAALARLGVEDGGKILIAMAAEPVERLRVLAYAEELDLLGEVDEAYSNALARAEAEIVTYLSQPTQIGITPQHIELIDHREQAWPGYDEPRSCYLFQFVYQFPTGEFTNIGIAGPLTMTSEADLTGLSHEDIYALFVGWHVDHADIYATDAERVLGTQQLEMDRLLSSLTDYDEFDEVVPALLGTMFARQVLIAAARRRGEAGWASASEDAISWLSLGDPHRPLQAIDAFHIFVGRSLLRSFN